MSMAHGNNYDYHRTTFDGERNERCVCCVRTMKWFPVLFIASVIGWSYYAYVIQLSFFTVTNIVQRILFLLFYHGVLVMFLWSYYQTVFTDIGRVPSRFRVPRAELDRIVRATNEEEQKQILESFAKELPVVTRTLNATVRFCEKCRLIKPDRAHHCSVCGVCVLKLDHHCPWVNNCINFTNYKYFILFLGYALLYCLYVACSTIPYMQLLWTGKIDGRFHILFLFFVSVMFAISLVSLFGYHVYLVLLNRTTLESFRTPIFRYGGPDKNGFSLGKLNNFQEVFGDDWRLWFVPVYTSLGDGILFPTQSHHLASNSPHDVGSPVAPLTAITGGNLNCNGAVANGTVGVDVPQPPQTIVLEHVDETKDGGGHPRLGQQQTVAMPLNTNGIFPLQETKESFTSTQPLYMGDGVVYPMRCYDEDAEALLGGEQQHNRGGTENLHDFEAATFLNEYGNLMH